MSLRSMLFPGRGSPAADSASPSTPSSGGLRSTPATPGAAAPSRKEERSAHREQLYAVVRESMLRAGVLSSGYKFKVLSLDGHGRSFLVMMDTLPGATPPADPPGVEQAIADAARQRHGIEVTGVYWRMPPAQAPERAAQPARPSAAEPATPAATDADAGVQALREAFARDRERAPAEPGAAAGHGPRSYTLLTGFEDTEIGTGQRLPPLGNTQYGEP